MNVQEALHLFARNYILKLYSVFIYYVWFFFLFSLNLFCLALDQLYALYVWYIS